MIEQNHQGWYGLSSPAVKQGARTLRDPIKSELFQLIQHYTKVPISEEVGHLTEAVEHSPVTQMYVKEILKLIKK